MIFKRAYRFRLEPTIDQEHQLFCQAGARRFVWNWALARRREYYAATGKTLTYCMQAAELTVLKKQPGTEWLKGFDSQSAQQTLKDLDRAFSNFFQGRARFPRFKRAKDQSQGFRIPQRVTVEGERIYCPKIGWIDLRLSQPIEGKTKSATFKADARGHWFVTLANEFELPDAPLLEPQKPVGIDLGLIDFATPSKGEPTAAPKFYRKAARKLRRANKALARAKRGSKNRHKAKQRLARVHLKIDNQRQDFVHKLTTQFVSEFDLIAIENLNNKSLAKTKLAKSILDAAFGEFRRQMEYKTQWNYRRCVVVSRWFPSSKQCNCCKHVLKELPRGLRGWVCPECGTLHDRDKNAALNIETEGLRLFAEGHPENGNACGAAVRPAEMEGTPQ
jgi:putative transposase